MSKRIWTVSLAVLLFGAVACPAQLAITEVMTSESSTSNGVPGAPTHPDWWELSNFGTNDVDLTGYSWNDDSHNGLFSADSTPFNGAIIHAGEAVIFAQQNAIITDPDAFRAWWGLAPSVQVFLYPAADPGLGAGGDSVRLWNTNNLNGDFDISFDEAPEFQVDRVNVGVAIQGRTFTYNTNSGAFDLYSTNGAGGAFRAVTADDEGSPGVAPAYDPPFVTRQPTNYTTTVGQSAAFTIAARGLPHPKFHWQFNGSPIDTNTPGLTISFANGVGTLSLVNVQSNQAGIYRAIVDNGLPSFASSNAVLTVNAAATAPVITQFPESVNAYAGQTVTFTVQALGNPPPTYSWQFSGGAIIGAVGPPTTNTLVISVSDNSQSGTYTCIVTNAGGGTNVFATLTVTPKPNLIITEVESSEKNPTTHHGDWWELSNFGNEAVDLHGFRMNDSHTLGSAYTITNHAVIQPGESVIFLERTTTAGQEVNEATFRTWWGSNLPPNLQIITYDGTGRGLSGSGDEVRVWNQAATQEADRVAAVAFSTATAGVSFTFDPQSTNQLGFAGNTTQGSSTNGLNGALASAESGDIGSPGRIVNWPGTITAGNSGAQLSWFSQPNWDYFVEFKTNLTDTTWLTLTNVTSGDTNAFGISVAVPAVQRFYRVGLKTHK